MKGCGVGRVVVVLLLCMCVAFASAKHYRGGRRSGTRDIADEQRQVREAIAKLDADMASGSLPGDTKDMLKAARDKLQQNLEHLNAEAAGKPSPTAAVRRGGAAAAAAADSSDSDSDSDAPKPPPRGGSVVPDRHVPRRGRHHSEEDDEEDEDEEDSHEHEENQHRQRKNDHDHASASDSDRSVFVEEHTHSSSSPSAVKPVAAPAAAAPAAVPAAPAPAAAAPAAPAPVSHLESSSKLHHDDDDEQDSDREQQQRERDDHHRHRRHDKKTPDRHHGVRETVDQQSADQARQDAWSLAEQMAETRAILAAEAEAAKFSGMRLETKAGTNEKVLYVNSYLLGLLALGTFIVGATLSWGMCKCFDACCREPNY